jgi:uncharacterized membrane protein
VDKPVRAWLESADHTTLHRLRGEHIVPPPEDEKRTRGQKIADTVAAVMGSWGFILIQSAILVLWILANVLAWVQAWDPYPFILLNLALSFQAAYAAPIIMMSQNRQAAIDRAHAEMDYQVNLRAELEIQVLQNKLDHLLDVEIPAIRAAVEKGRK